MENFKLGQSTEYKTSYDPSLIDVFPRESRREGIIVPMFGVDVWTCYEFSFLLPSGKPYFGVIRILNNSESKYIFESKSLKLYLNSFNNSIFSSLSEAVDIIKKDLSLCVESTIKVCEVNSFPDFSSLGQCIDSLNITTKDYQYNKELLQVSYRRKISADTVYSNLLRSNCEVTGQPDWGRISISYVSTNGLILNRDSLLRYIISFRNHKGFHEVVCERIYSDLYEKLEKPERLSVLCQYTRRGGIDINPFRISLPESINYSIFTKLLQQ